MKRKRKKKRKEYSAIKKFFISFCFLILFGGAGMTYELYNRIYQPNIILPKEIYEDYIYIPTNSNFSDVVEILSKNGFLINKNSFEWLARQKKYNNNIKAGRYKVNRSFNNNQLINLLRSGKQSPINVKFNNIRTKEQLAGKISQHIEADSSLIIE